MRVMRMSRQATPAVRSRARRAKAGGPRRRARREVGSSNRSDAAHARQCRAIADDWPARRAAARPTAEFEHRSRPRESAQRLAPAGGPLGGDEPKRVGLPLPSAMCPRPTSYDQRDPGGSRPPEVGTVRDRRHGHGCPDTATEPPPFGMFQPARIRDDGDLPDNRSRPSAYGSPLERRPGWRRRAPAMLP